MIRLELRSPGYGIEFLPGEKSRRRGVLIAATSEEGYIKM
jgi:hypothetical protein